MNCKPTRTTRAVAGGAVCLLMLAAVGFETLSRPSVQDAAPYHERVAEAIDTIPYHIDDWVGRDEPPPPEAIELLRPNALFSRRFQNIDTGEVVSVVIVQTQDARDLAGHYPPICYPAHGWNQKDAQPLDIQVAGMSIPTTRYEFAQTRHRGGLSDEMTMSIDNFLITPSGEIVRDMGRVRELAGDYSRRMFGAAQVQLVFYREVEEERREEIFGTFVGAASEAIQAIREGEVDDDE